MKASHRKDVIIARLIFAAMCLFLIAIIAVIVINVTSKNSKKSEPGNAEQNVVSESEKESENDTEFESAYLVIQQKVVLARWLATNPKILILNGPTVGVDIGAKYDIHKLLRNLAKQGMAVLVVSDDVAEITALCDRALIMKAGKMTQEFKGADLTDDNLYQATI